MTISRWKYVFLTANIVVILIGFLTVYISFTTRGLDRLWEQVPLDTKLNKQFHVIFNDYGTSIILCLTVTVQGICGSYVTFHYNNEVVMSIYWGLQLFTLMEQMIFYYFLMTLLYEREKITKEGLRELLIMYSDDPNSPNNKYMDMIQTQLNCCGNEDHVEWTQYIGHIPGSCCVEKRKPICTVEDVREKQSCLYPATDSFQAFLMVRMVIAWLVLTVLIIILASYSVLEEEMRKKLKANRRFPVQENPIDRNIDIDS